LSAPGESPPRLGELDHALAIGFLCGSRSILAMNAREAAIAAGLMTPRHYPSGALVFREGDSTSSTYMLWILQGEASVETVPANPRDAMTMTVLEAGSTLGEMGLMDGGKRSITCTACSSLRCAVLTRESLRTLAARHPEVAVKLMSIVCMGLSNRLRDVTEKFKRQVLMFNVISEEHPEAMPTIRSDDS
jgi:CRP/FNR family transcriptional regulator, cyclic AMP receptor protein